jgi:hypothetical protein
MHYTTQHYERINTTKQQYLQVTTGPVAQFHQYIHPLYSSRNVAVRSVVLGASRLTDYKGAIYSCNWAVPRGRAIVLRF